MGAVVPEAPAALIIPRDAHSAGLFPPVGGDFSSVQSHGEN